MLDSIRCFVPASILVSAGALSSGIANAQLIDTRVIVATGDPVPGVSGAEFAGFLSSPVVNRRGEVAFRALYSEDPDALNGLRSGLVRTTPDGLEFFMRAGEAAPGLPGVTFVRALNPTIADNGDIAFFATLDGATGEDAVYRFDHSTSQLEVVAVERDDIPGDDLAPIGSIATFPAIMPNGDVAFRAILSIVPPSDVISITDDVILRTREGELEVVAREGEPSPDGQGEFESFLTPRVTQDNTVTFRARIRNLGAATGDVSAIDGDDGLQVFLRRGRPAFGGVDIVRSAIEPRVSLDGVASFYLSLETPDGTIRDVHYFGPLDDLRVVNEGLFPVGSPPGFFVTGFGNPYYSNMNRRAQIANVGSYTLINGFPLANVISVYGEEGASIVAFEGDEIAGGGGYKIAEIIETQSALSDAGNVVFVARLEGPDGPLPDDADLALIGHDPFTGVLYRIVGQGQRWTRRDGSIDTVDTFGFERFDLEGSNGVGGERDVVYVVVFESGDEIIAITTLPAGCGDADLSEPLGVLDMADIDTFMHAFVANEPAANLVPPMGIVDLDDVDTFIVAFLAGCP